MKEPGDREKVNEFGEIEAFKNTGYWFKKDTETIKKSFISTLKFSPVLITGTTLFCLIYIRSISGEILTKTSLILIISMSLLCILGYFLFHAIMTKGYDIHPYQGTHIGIGEHKNRFSIKYLLSSELKPGQKVLHLIRLFFYLLLVIGLFLNILESVS